MASTNQNNSQNDISFQYGDETRTQKLARKSKDSPFMVAGLTGCTLVVIYGAYRFKHARNFPISIYLMQLRVAAQGTVIGCLSIGVCYKLFRKFFPKPVDE